MGSRTDWEEIERLGGGGQSDVYLVRNPKRRADRAKCLDEIRSALDGDKRAELATAICSYAREDFPSERGALKAYKIPPEGFPRVLSTEESEAIERLRTEIAVLSQNRPGLPKLLDSNLSERWIVTEFFPERTLEHSPSRYKGKAALALKAFRSLVQTMAALHKDGHVHRDIKPANVFVRSSGELVLGDFGVVFVPNTADRVTLTGERVGPRDYLPPWANLGVRLEKVEPSIDVYMLGKLLWSMVDGRSFLPREYHKDPEYHFDLTKTYPKDPDMYAVNQILDQCVVGRASECLSSANDLLIIVSTLLGLIERGGQLLNEGVPRPCHICGNGYYQPQVLRQGRKGGTLRIWASGEAMDIESMPVQIFACDSCHHVEFFRT
jgi:serine/threonine protein kinase